MTRRMKVPHVEYARAQVSSLLLGQGLLGGPHLVLDVLQGVRGHLNVGCSYLQARVPYVAIY